MKLGEVVVTHVYYNSLWGAKWAKSPVIGKYEYHLSVMLGW